METGKKEQGTYGGGAAFFCGKWPVLAPGDKHKKVRYRIRKESSSGQDQYRRKKEHQSPSINFQKGLEE